MTQEQCRYCEKRGHIERACRAKCRDQRGERPRGRHLRRTRRLKKLQYNKQDDESEDERELEKYTHVGNGVVAGSDSHICDGGGRGKASEDGIGHGSCSFLDAILSIRLIPLKNGR